MTTDDDRDDDILTANQMVAEYGFVRGTLRSWRYRKTGPPSFTLGANGRVVYRRRDVEKWLADVERASRRGDGVPDAETHTQRKR